MRKGETANIPLDAKTVPLILVRDGQVTDAYSASEKLNLLLSRKDKDIFLCVWPGKWSSDVFEVDPEDAIRILK